MRIFLSTLLVLLTTLHALPARAAVSLVASSDRVRAGERVTFEWSGLSARAEEVELEWSLDDGRWLRLSPELEAHEGRFAWTVPAGHSGRALVRLRAGEAHNEDVVATLELEIVAAAQVRPRGVGEDEEWWNLATDSHLPFRAALGQDRASFVPFAAPAAVAPDAQEHVGAPAAASPIRFARTHPALPTDARARAFSAPRSTPLRN